MFGEKRIYGSKKEEGREAKVNKLLGHRLGVLAMLLAMVSAMTAEKSEPARFETVQNSNAAILQRLGLVPVQIPDGHHKKRLSGPEPSDAMDIPLGSQTRIHQPYSRRHGHRDSHVYVVKLPPSQPYYTLTKPHKAGQQAQKDNDGKSSGSSSPQVGFQSNGKPGKIYHWNLPLVKKISEKKKFRAQTKMDQLKKRLQERNDERLTDLKTLTEQPTDRANAAALPAAPKRPAMLKDSSKNSSSPHQSNAKRYHHLSSVNSLDQDDKLVKHMRNNDKWLDYPRVPEPLRASGRPEETAKKESRDEAHEKPSKNNKKSYRLEDSNLYRLESRNDNERHKNDRLPLWSLSNELHASGNTRNSLRPKKHRKKAAMSYYAPINARTGKIDPTSATNIQNNFPGNGKPKAFYVMEKSRQPIYYHPLLP